MTLKVCFNNQIHKITKLPANYSTLLQKVSEVFGSQLPQNWTLQYLDSDNDRIMLKNQEDYENFLDEQQVSDSKKTVKIFVLTYEDIQNNTDLSSSAASESFEEAMNEESQSTSSKSTYVEGPQDRVEIEEEIIEKPQPEPFDEKLGGLIQERFATPVKEEEPKRVVIEKTHQQKPKPQPQPQAQAQQPKKTPQPQARAQENKPKAAQPSAERQQQPKRNAPRDIFSDLFGGFGEQAPVSTPTHRPQTQETSRPKPKQQQQRAQRAQPTVHREVQCNGCGMYPITGIRYKCYQCPNFDFCERCEATRYHPHEFMEFTKPEPESERTNQYHGNRNNQYYGGRNSAYGRQPQYSQYRDDPFGFSPFASPRMSESYRPRTQHTPRRSDFGFFPMFI